MNIIIPIGGKGERFKKDGYSQPKHLIDIFGKPMILYVLDNLSITSDDTIFIITYKHGDNFENIINNKYSNVNIIYISKQTEGAAETLFLGIESLICKNKMNDNPVMILDCDTFYSKHL
jgi:dTDP-glucose pyrophosphorylase